MAHIAFTAPHQTAANIGFEFLKEGAHAVDAMIAAAAAISVVYPHMNSIGGDGFWLIQEPGRAPVAIDASGTAATKSSIQAYREMGREEIPARGPDACVTMAGTVAGWQLARDTFNKARASLRDLFAPATELAKQGIAASTSLAAASAKCLGEIEALQSQRESFTDFKSLFAKHDAPLKAGDKVINYPLADVLDHLAVAGLDDFYRGDVAATLAKELQKTGSPIEQRDFVEYSAQVVKPLRTDIRFATLFNMPPPTQGLASLLILAIYDTLHREGLNEVERVHRLIEATKQAFKIRDAKIADPARMPTSAQSYLDRYHVEQLAAAVGDQASPWPNTAQTGDTIWMGCTDKNGVMVSFIQSTYWEFGSGVVLPGTGIVWNNRGSSFTLESGHHNALQAGMKPFHTLNPALAVFQDGRRAVYGTMGGEGQPQTQAALFMRRFYENSSLEDAIARARWLLGRTWGQADSNLKMEEELYQAIGSELEQRGHAITVVPNHVEMMGHAGGIVMAADGKVECATDPRSDGAAFTSVI